MCNNIKISARGKKKSMKINLKIKQNINPAPKAPKWANNNNYYYYYRFM